MDEAANKVIESAVAASAILVTYKVRAFACHYSSIIYGDDLWGCRKSERLTNTSRDNVLGDGRKHSIPLPGLEKL